MSAPAIPLRISTDRAELDVAMIHQFLSQQSYWKRGVARKLVQKCIDHSLCFGGYVGADQVAFASVVTDYASFAYLRDVFVLPAHRGHAYGKQLLRAVLAHPDLANVSWLLKTADAQGLYRQVGFSEPDAAGLALFMQRPAPPP